MADWTNIPDASLEVGKPAKSIDVYALRDNPVAIAEGAVGAPRIQTAAIENNAITEEKLLQCVSGTEYDLFFGQEYEFMLENVPSYINWFVFQCVRGGQILITWEERVTWGVSMSRMFSPPDTGYNENTTTGTEWENKNWAPTLRPGQMAFIQIKSSYRSHYRNFKIRSGVEGACVVVAYAMNPFYVIEP